MSKIKSGKLLGIIGCSIIIISLFLPIMEVSFLGLSKNVNYISGDGKIILALSIITLLLIFADELSKIIPFFAKLTNSKLTLIPTFISAIIVINFFVHLHSNNLGQFYLYGIGLYLLCAGIIVTAVYGFVHRSNNNN